MVLLALIRAREHYRNQRNARRWWVSPWIERRLMFRQNSIHWCKSWSGSLSMISLDSWGWSLTILFSLSCTHHGHVVADVTTRNIFWHFARQCHDNFFYRSFTTKNQTICCDRGPFKFSIMISLIEVFCLYGYNIWSGFRALKAILLKVKWTQSRAGWSLRTLPMVCSNGRNHNSTLYFPIVTTPNLKLLRVRRRRVSYWSRIYLSSIPEHFISHQD